MIEVFVSRTPEGKILQYEIRGHAGASAHGEDIVCAAVSVLSQTTLLALQEIVGIQVKYQRREGYLICKIPGNLTEKQQENADLLLETMIMGLNNIKIGYPQYIELHHKEV